MSVICDVEGLATSVASRQVARNPMQPRTFFHVARMLIERSSNTRMLEIPLANKRLHGASILAAIALAIVGCGGGGGGSGSPSTGNQNDPGGSGNAAPTIQGQPGTTVGVSQTYTFRPSASDSNGDSLTYSAANLPDWLSLNAATGALSGTPTAADIGTYSNITITVSDGRLSASLPAFSIAVTDLGSGSASLSWEPPTQNEDGSPLVNLSGYRILYGQDPYSLTNEVSISNPSLSRYVVENLTTGTWYFAVAAVNSAGVMSERSNIGSKTIS